MAPTKTPEVHRDVHGVGTYIEKRVQQLAGSGPVGSRIEANPTREQRKAMLQFMEERAAQASLLRRRTYLAWLPVLAGRMGPEFLRPTSAAVRAFDLAMPPLKGDARARSESGRGGYARGSRATAAQALGAFWRWRAGTPDGQLPPHLKIKLPKWTPSVDSEGMLTPEEVRALVAQTGNLRDAAWIWTVYASACRPGEIFRLRLGDVVVHHEGVTPQLCG